MHLPNPQIWPGSHIQCPSLGWPHLPVSQSTSRILSGLALATHQHKGPPIPSPSFSTQSNIPPHSRLGPSHMFYKPSSLLCPPDLIPSKPLPTSNPAHPHTLSSAPTCSVHIRHRTNKRSLHVQIPLQTYKQHERLSQYLLSKLTSPAEIFANDNYLDESEDIEFKRTIINYLKECMGKEDTKKLLSKIKEKELFSILSMFVIGI